MELKPPIVVTHKEFTPDILGKAGPEQMVTVVDDNDGHLIFAIGGPMTEPLEQERRVRKAEALAAAMRDAALCEGCRKPATCVGEYETCGEHVGFACDDCCGHGNEDGWCEPIQEAGERLIKRQRDAMLRKDAEHHAQILAMRDWVAGWLVRARLALYREGWEEGMSYKEMTDALTAVLFNLGCDDGSERPADVAETKRLLAMKPSYHLPIDGDDLLKTLADEAAALRESGEALVTTAMDAYTNARTALLRLKELATYHGADLGDRIDMVLTVIDEGLASPSTNGHKEP